MDNNMIKIDDLLRQRLDGAEEQERPAAWMQMRDLLDKQMPVGKVPAAYNWRRMFAYVAGVAILAAVSVGGYEMSESFSSNIPAEENTYAPKPSATVGLAGSATNATPDTRVEALAAQQPATATDAAGTHLAANTATNSNTAANTANNTNAKNTWSSANNTATRATAPKNVADANGNTTAANTTTKNVANTYNNSTASGTKPAASGTNANSNIGQNNKNTTNTSHTANTNSNDNRGNTQSAVATANTQNTNNSNNNNPKGSNNSVSVNNNSATASSTIGKTEVPKSTTALNGKEIAEAGEKYKEVPYHKIERKGKEGVDKVDTIFNGEDVRKVKQTSGAIAANTNDLAMGGDIMPASEAGAVKEQSKANAPSEKLGANKTAGQKGKKGKSISFEEMVQNAKYSMGKVKFYPGLVAGANMALNGNFGAHIGLAGNLTLNDRWAILTEVKYAYKWNSAKEKMQDDYITNVSPAVINGQSVYKYDSMEHYYNFANYSTIDIPLMVTYNSNKLIFMAGANFRYNLKISNLAEVEQIYLSEQEIRTSATPVVASDKKILLSDFGSSMNLGPVLGVGYQMDNSCRLDMRLTQSVWNNSSTFGQKTINKELFNMPQLQFNIHYRFISKNPNRRPR